MNTRPEERKGYAPRTADEIRERALVQARRTHRPVLYRRTRATGGAWTHWYLCEDGTAIRRRVEAY
jgi:hypothetical protein